MTLKAIEIYESGSLILQVPQLDFASAALVFDGPVQTAMDDRRDYGEERIIAIGEVDGVVLVVVYTDRGEVRRIISARYANKRERQIWQSFVNP